MTAMPLSNSQTLDLQKKQVLACKRHAIRRIMLVSLVYEMGYVEHGEQLK